MAVTGLQRNVIAMAFWCKSDGGQHQGIQPPPIATQHRYYGRFITVLRRDWVVVAGLRIRLTGWSARTTSDTVLRCRLVTACHGRCLYIGLASACAFTTTLMTLSDTLIHSNAKGWCRKSSSLHPRLFRGVTPYRHDGESLCPAPDQHQAWLAHSGDPEGVAGEANKEPVRPLTTHVPYAVHLAGYVSGEGFHLSCGFSTQARACVT